jgi:hypothetical protein
MKRTMLLISVLVWLPPVTHGAGDAPLDRATLRGLKSVGIVIDSLDPELQKLGVTADFLASELIARLRASHVSVDPSPAEFIGLRITSVRGNRGPFALSVTIGLYQPVLLSRDHNLRTSTETWEVESVVMAEPKLVQTACRETAGELAGRFAAAYHAVNPE